MSRRRCFWPGCSTRIQMTQLGCRMHWYRLPREMRNAVSTTYRDGARLAEQSTEYHEALRAAVAFAIEAAGREGRAA